MGRGVGGGGWGGVGGWGGGGGGSGVGWPGVGGGGGGWGGGGVGWWRWLMSGVGCRSRRRVTRPWLELVWSGGRGLSATGGRGCSCRCVAGGPPMTESVDVRERVRSGERALRGARAVALGLI